MYFLEIETKNVEFTWIYVGIWFIDTRQTSVKATRSLYDKINLKIDLNTGVVSKGVSKIFVMYLYLVIERHNMYLRIYISGLYVVCSSSVYICSEFVSITFRALNS
jgi:hypothetical protein